jgi:hypothetical protein
VLGADALDQDRAQSRDLGLHLRRLLLQRVNDDFLALARPAGVDAVALSAKTWEPACVT